jgi:hypothetical protein
MTESLNELIRPDVPTLALHRHALTYGMPPLRSAGGLKVALLLEVAAICSCAIVFY